MPEPPPTGAAAARAAPSAVPVTLAGLVERSMRGLIAGLAALPPEDRRRVTRLEVRIGIGAEAAPPTRPAPPSARD